MKVEKLMDYLYTSIMSMIKFGVLQKLRFKGIDEQLLRVIRSLYEVY